MIAKKIASVVMALSFFYFGCAANTGMEEKLTSPGPVISIDVDNKAKLKYLQNIKNSIKSYNRVILDIKYYHRYNFKELAKEIEKYVETYVRDILLEPESNSSIETRVEIAQIHLLVTSLYLDIGYNINALTYLESFHDRYHNDASLLEKTLDPRDIGYSILGQGMRILEKRASSEVMPLVHGKVYPWEKSHGKIYPWRNPNM